MSELLDEMKLQALENEDGHKLDKREENKLLTNEEEEEEKKQFEK